VFAGEYSRLTLNGEAWRAARRRRVLVPVVTQHTLLVAVEGRLRSSQRMC